MPRNDRKRRVLGNSACLPTKLKSRSVVDLITSGVDVSGVDEYCRPKPSTKTATITGSSATSLDFLGNLIAPSILVLTNDQEKLVRAAVHLFLTRLFAWIFQASLWNYIFLGGVFFLSSFFSFFFFSFFFFWSDIASLREGHCKIFFVALDVLLNWFIAVLSWSLMPGAIRSQVVLIVSLPTNW